MRWVKISTDILLIVCLFTTLLYRWTGHELHSIAGYGWLLAVVLHSIWNRGWYANLLRGKYTWLRSISSVLAGLLWVCTAGVILSAIGLAHFSQEIDCVLVLRRIHIGGAYWLLVIGGLHAGLHIEALSAPLRSYSLLRKTRKFLLSLAWIAAATGIWAAWQLSIGPVLLFSAPFAANGGNGVYLAVQLAAVFWFCAFAAHLFTRRMICK